MKTYRAAVIGLGFIGPLHVDALNRVPRASVTALCDCDAQLAGTLAERYNARAFTDWHDVVRDPEVDVIHNCLPPALHDEVNREAILHGKHVYCEKPLSLTADDAKRIALLAEEHGVRAGLNHQYRMNAAVQEMRARVQKGLAGKVLAMNGCYLQESASRRTDWTGRMANTGIARAISDIGTHWADTAECVLGQPITEVFADLHIHYPVRTDDRGGTHQMDTEDTGFIIVRFADGTPGQVMISKSACGHKNDLQVSVWAEEYSLEWHQEVPDRLILGRKDTGFETFYMNKRTCLEETKKYITAPTGHMMGWPDALKNAMQAYYDSLDDDPRADVPYATFRDGFRRLAFVEACVRSSREKAWVEVEQW